MGRHAEHLARDEGEIARLESLSRELPDEARVRVTLRNGDALTGTVVERPKIQVFEGADGEQGMNANLRLDISGDTPPTDVWLSDVVAVESLDTRKR
jgi:uncharacterized protein DUF3247